MKLQTHNHDCSKFSIYQTMYISNIQFSKQAKQAANIIKQIWNYITKQNNKMNPSQVESYNNVSIDELLQSELNNPDPRTWVLVLAKARIQQCTQNSLIMTLMLLSRDGDKWLEILKRFSFLQFKMVFSFCIRKMKTYEALMQSVYKLGEHEHQRMLEQNIENAMQGQQPIDSTITTNQLWTLYLSYLSQCTTSTPNRTLFALQNIQRRLSSVNNIYSLLVDLQKAHFIEILCRMLKFHEDEFLRKLELRKFWQSISNTIRFLRMTMNTDGLMMRLMVKLKRFEMGEEQGCGRDGLGRMDQWRGKRMEQSSQASKQLIVTTLTRASRVSILQDIFIYHAQRLAIQLLQIPLISNPTSYSQQQLQHLQTSLIYHIQSDDFPSLLTQLLLSLTQHIPNFINTFVSQCMFFLIKDMVEDVTTTDIILKLCVLSKVIVQQSEEDGWDFSIKELVDKLVMLSDSRSEVIQVKTLGLMHYFKEILPQAYFLQYHQAVFRILKHIIIEQINNPTHQLPQSPSTCNNPISNYKPFQYTLISFTECVKILQQQTQQNDQHHQPNLQLRIRKRKFTNHTYINDLFRNNILSIADKLIHLVTIQGYCQHQCKLLTILRNLLEKYHIVMQRNTIYLIKVLVKQFMAEYDRLCGISNIRNKNYSKILLLLQCLELVWGEVTEQTYFQCQQSMIPVLTLLNQHHTVDFQDDIIKLLSLMIFKARMITPQLNNFIIYMKRILNNSQQSSLLSIESVLKQMCKPCIVRSVREEWKGLVEYITNNMFGQYLRFVMENRTFQLYEKDWVCAMHVIMLFVQSYHEEYQHEKELTEALWNLQTILLRYGVQNEQTHQLLMTIHHIMAGATITMKPSALMLNFNNPNTTTTKTPMFTTLPPLQQLTQLTLYRQHYSLHLLQLTFLDVLNINLRTGNFDFSQPHNPLYQFIDLYKYLRMHVQDSIHYCKLSSSPNDLLPFNKINLNQYASFILDSLHKLKIIDIQQFTQLKSIFLPHHYLVSYKLFQS